MDKNKTAVEIFNKLADVYQQKFMDVSIYHASLDLFCNYLSRKNACVLELACGPGNLTAYLLKKEPGLKILGTDLSENMLQLAATNNPTAVFNLMDAREIATVGKKIRCSGMWILFAIFF